jgi:hypothetical protein
MLSQEAMVAALFPSRVFESRNVMEGNVARPVWKCLICERLIDSKWGISTSISVVAVRKKHTILQCCASFAAIPDREQAIDSACQRLMDILKRRDKKDEVLVAFRTGLGKLPTVDMTLPATGSGDVEDGAGEGDVGEVAPVGKPTAPTPSVFNPVGRSVAKYFSLESGRKELHLGKVGGLLPLAVRNENRVLVQAWKVLWDDHDSEDMERKELLQALALARRVMKYGPHNHGHEWVAADMEDSVMDVGDLEAPGLDDEAHMRRMPFDVGVPQLVNRGEDWNNPVAHGAVQNKISYCIDYFLDKAEKKVSNEFIRKRLRREAVVFGADLPGDIRRLATDMGTRKVVDVTRHKCPDCDHAWLGPVHPRDFVISEVCPDCGSPRYCQTSTGIKPRSTFFYFGVAHAISAMHNTPSFRAAFKKNVDLTINSYRNSPDGRRLNKATGGEAFAPDNGLYVCFADGFRPHESSHQGLTGMHPLYMFLCFTS